MSFASLCILQGREASTGGLFFLASDRQVLVHPVFCLFVCLEQENEYITLQQTTHTTSYLGSLCLCILIFTMLMRWSMVKCVSQCLAQGKHSLSTGNYHYSYHGHHCHHHHHHFYHHQWCSNPDCSATQALWMGEPSIGTSCNYVMKPIGLVVKRKTWR